MSDMSPNQPPNEHVRPRWLKISLIVAIVLIVVLAVVLLITGGHGPGRHTAIAAPPVLGMALV